MEKVEGDVKQGAANLTGDGKLQSDGKADKVEARIRNAVGGIKDALTGKDKAGR
ncbi:CsbD family protein [Skermanella pratensis]|uniref:CsbD family protein n=1 Tax=Skermanella pratensis TaxID=2233999 RepID=UPI0013017345|nr:CsbD family protein [Skermanella pratensis]